MLWLTFHVVPPIHFSLSKEDQPSIIIKPLKAPVPKGYVKLSYGQLWRQSSPRSKVLIVGSLVFYCFSKRDIILTLVTHIDFFVDSQERNLLLLLSFS